VIRTRLTAANIARAIKQLPPNRRYNYIAKPTKTTLEVVDVVDPEGPITIHRYTPSKSGDKAPSVKKQTISAAMIRRVADAMSIGLPRNLDRVLGGSYNTRSALEALMAHTPEFYYGYPGRVENFETSSVIKRGHKHLMWLPDEPHPNGVTRERDMEGMAVSEAASIDVVYDALVLVPESEIEAQIENAVPKEIRRRHAQIQVLLLEIGRQLGFRTWVAQNDKGILYKGQRLGEMDGVVVRLDDVQLLASFGEAIRAALMIDVIWFRNGRLMPAVIEIEHTTGITPGLTRMRKFQDKVPPVPTRWVIAAADADRDNVLKETNNPQFASMKPKFFPYSAVEELNWLCKKRKIKGVTEEFLDSFMEPCLPGLQ